jgi:hypothetical protein
VWCDPTHDLPDVGSALDHPVTVEMGLSSFDRNDSTGRDLSIQNADSHVLQLIPATESAYGSVCQSDLVRVVNDRCGPSRTVRPLQRPKDSSMVASASSNGAEVWDGLQPS